jgi:phosphinothricin acetyltransferase
MTRVDQVQPVDAPLPSDGNPRSAASYALRSGYADDLHDLWRLYNGIVAEGSFTGHLDPLPLSDRRRWLEGHLDPRFPLIVASDDLGIVGYATISPWREGRRALDGTVEASVFLAPRARGRGLGRKLLTEIVSKARALGHEKILAIVFDTNAASLGLLESLGFERWGHLPGTATLPTGRCGHFMLGFDLLAAGAGR